jgi:recombinational DNA repair protein RecT
METNSNLKLNIIQKIEQVSPAQLATLPEVADRFMHLYSIMNGRNADMARVAYESEKFHFMKLLQDKPDLKKCTKLSLYGCFIDMAVNGLSFDPAMKHAYIVGFPTNIGTRDNPKWETRASVLIDGRGELVIRTKQGQIKYADNPVVVWSCDSFMHGTKEDRKFVDHSAVHPRPADAEIIACYLKITRPDGTLDYSVMDIEDVMDLKAFSKQPESLAWTKGLKGMVETKTLKHAFKSYPKVKLGNFSKLQTQVIDGPDEPEFKIDYGLNGSMPANNLPEAAGTYAPSMIVEPVKEQAPISNLSDDSFMEEETQPSGPGKSFDDDNF